MSEIKALREMVERLVTRVQALELGREFKTLPVMVSEKETIDDLVSLAALKFGCSEASIREKGKRQPVSESARRWVCQEAHLARSIPIDFIAYILGDRNRSTIYTAIHGRSTDK